MKVAVDVVVYREDGNILFVERKNEPFKGMLALPGGFVEDDEKVIDAAVREVWEETGLRLDRLRMCYVSTYDAPNRDSRGRVISICYYAEVGMNAQTTQPLAFGSDAANAKFLSPGECPNELAFDHWQMVGDAMQKVITRDQADLMRALSSVAYGPSSGLFTP